MKITLLNSSKIGLNYYRLNLMIRHTHTKRTVVRRESKKGKTAKLICFTFCICVQYNETNEVEFGSYPFKSHQ